jgi:ABC-2 type transport system permease protein
MYIVSVCSEVIKGDKLDKLSSQQNLDPQIIAAVRQIAEAPTEVDLQTKSLDREGKEEDTDFWASAGIGWISTFLMYMFVIVYGSMVLAGVVEEKANRIVEVMVSSVKPFTLMMGKILGIFLVGVTQLLIWALLCFFLFKGASLTMHTFDAMPDIIDFLLKIDWATILIYFLIYFLGGFLMYASMFAMFGASVDNAQDAQQFMTPITFLFLFALYAGMYSVENPNGPLAFWCSMIPLTSPVVMMMRLPFHVPWWQPVVSVLLLYITAVGVVLVSAKVYRIGILMYGKKPSLKELVKWMRYK